MRQLIAGRARIAAIVAAAATVAFGLFVIGGDGYQPQRIRLHSGQAWLASSAVGQLTLLDGSSVEVAARVPAAPAGNQLDVVQYDRQAYAVDRTLGSIRRVDPATFEVSPVVTPLPGAGTRLAVVAGSDSTYAIDTERGVLSALDPGSLRRLGDPIAVFPGIDERAYQIDRDGRLWLLDRGSGDLIRLDGASRHVRRGAAGRDAGALVLADGLPVLVDTSHRTAATLDPTDGSVLHTTTLDLRTDFSPLAVGATHGQQLYVMLSRGVLALCDLRDDQCSRVVTVGRPDGDFGPPVEVSGRVFVPDYSTGSVWVVDVSDAAVVANPRVLDPGVPFQLVAKHGIVYFNDRAGERAGVVRLDGSVRHVVKYQRNDPSRGLSTPTPTATPSPKPAVSRTAPPTTRPRPTPPGPTGGPPGSQARINSVTIKLSRNTAVVGEPILFQAQPTGSTITSAQWRFGDGGLGEGVTVEHAWNAVGTYQVSVQATFADATTTTASVAVTIRAANVPQATLTLQVQGSGTVAVGTTVCPPTCTVTADRGTSLQVTARPGASAHLSAWGGACTGNASTCTVALDADRTVSAAFAGTLAAPTLNSPANGWRYHAVPRTATLYWYAVSGAARYDVEIQRDGTSWQSATTTATQLGFEFPGDGAGQWRVAAVGVDGVRGAFSPWRSFTWDTTAINAFAGDWHNVNPASQRKDMRITVNSSSTATMRMYECPPSQSSCSWVNWGNFTMKNGVLEQPQIDIEHPTITLTISGTQLTMYVNFTRMTDETETMTR